MSFAKARIPRFNETKVEVAGTTALKRSSSRTSVISQRSLQSPRILISQRSRSLSRSKANGKSATNLSETAPSTAGKTKIPIQNSKIASSPTNKAVAKRNMSPVDKNSTRPQSAPRPVLSGVKSTPSTSPAKTTAAARVSRISQEKSMAGGKTPATANIPPRSKSPNTPLPTGQLRKRVGSPSKAKSLSPIRKEATDKTVTPIVIKNLTQNHSSQEEEMIKEINLNLCSERRYSEKISYPTEVSINLEQFKDLVTFIPQESMSFCSQVIENRKILLTNLINNHIDSSEDNLQNEKLAQYLEEGDGLHQKYDFLKNSQCEISEKVMNAMRDLLQETLSLRSLSKELESKLELLETENIDISKQVKTFYEELENERKTTADLNHRKTQLEQQLKKYTQRVKELEDKLQNNSQQSAQIKSHETHLKQKEEKYQMLEQRYNQQAKQYRAAVDAKEKLEKQRDSLEARVIDLKKINNDQQNESMKVIESLKNQLNEILQELESEKNERSNLERELKETHERLMKLQEKSLELADVTELTKATIINEGSLTASEKEANLFMKLKDVQSSLDKANEEIKYFKEENDKLRSTVFQFTEKSEENKENNAESSLIDVLKTELNAKDGIIEKLQKQVDDYLKEVEERDHRITELRQKRDKQSAEGNKNKVSETEEALWCEIHQLRRRLEDGEALNENLQHKLAQKQLEVEQREKIMQEQTKVRDELLKLLREKNKAKTGQMSALQAKLEDHERNADTVTKFFSAKAEELQELYSTLEMKQRRVNQLEEEVKQMEDQQQRGQCQRTRMEARIAELELALHEKAALFSSCNNRCQTPGFYSTTGHSQTKRDLWQDAQQEISQHYFPFYKPTNQNRFHRLVRKPYTRQTSETSRSIIQLYKIHSSFWGDSNSSKSSVMIPNHWPSSTYYSEIEVLQRQNRC